MRKKPNVKWGVDRGKEPQELRPREQFPWFWDGDEFVGKRVNDVHLTNEEKRAARERERKRERERARAGVEQHEQVQRGSAG